MSDANSTNEYRFEVLNKTLSDHEDRITDLERFTLMTKGALAMVAFVLGSGVGTTVVLFILGVI